MRAGNDNLDARLKALGYKGFPSTSLEGAYEGNYLHPREQLEIPSHFYEMLKTRARQYNIRDALESKDRGVLFNALQEGEPSSFKVNVRIHMANRNVAGTPFGWIEMANTFDSEMDDYSLSQYFQRTMDQSMLVSLKKQETENRDPLPFKRSPLIFCGRRDFIAIANAADIRKYELMAQDFQRA